VNARLRARYLRTEAEALRPPGWRSRRGVRKRTIRKSLRPCSAQAQHWPGWLSGLLWRQDEPARSRPAGRQLDPSTGLKCRSVISRTWSKRKLGAAPGTFFDSCPIPRITQPAWSVCGPLRGLDFAWQSALPPQLLIEPEGQRRRLCGAGWIGARWRLGDQLGAAG